MPHTPEEILQQQVSMRENDIKQVAGSLRGQIDSLIRRDYDGHRVEVRIPLERFKSRVAVVLDACKTIVPEYESKGWFCSVQIEAADLLLDFRPQQTCRGDGSVVGSTKGSVHFVFGLPKTGKTKFAMGGTWCEPGASHVFDDEKQPMEAIFELAKKFSLMLARNVIVEIHATDEAKLRSLFEAFPDAQCHFMDRLSPIAQRIRAEGPSFLFEKKVAGPSVDEMRDFVTKLSYLDALIVNAIARFDPSPSNQTFNTAGIHGQLKIGSWMPSGDDVDRMLADDPRVVRLKGGAHWLLLPDGVERHKELGQGVG